MSTSDYGPAIEIQREQKRSRALELQSELYKLAGQLEAMTDLHRAYDRREYQGAAPAKLVEDFALTNFTVQPDFEMPETQDAVYLYFKGKPVAHMVIGFDRSPGLETGSAQAQMLDLVKNLRYYIDPTYLDTGELHELPLAWFGQVDEELGKLNDSEEARSIKTTINDPNFSFGNVKVRPSRGPAVGTQRGGNGESTYDYTLAVYHKGHLAFVFSGPKPNQEDLHYKEPEPAAKMVAKMALNYKENFKQEQSK